MPVISSCSHLLPPTSPTLHFVQTESGAPIPEGKCRITVMRERHWYGGKGSLQILLFNQAMDNTELNFLCYLGTKIFCFDAEQYKNIIAKNKEKLIFRKTDYDALDGFPVILKSYKHRAEFWSTHPQLLWELRHGMIMTPKKARDLLWKAGECL